MPHFPLKYVYIISIWILIYDVMITVAFNSINQESLYNTERLEDYMVFNWILLHFLFFQCISLLFFGWLVLVWVFVYLFVCFYLDSIYVHPSMLVLSLDLFFLSFSCIAFISVAFISKHQAIVKMLSFGKTLTDDQNVWKYWGRKQIWSRKSNRKH